MAGAQLCMNSGSTGEASEAGCRATQEGSAESYVVLSHL